MLSKPLSRVRKLAALVALATAAIASAVHEAQAGCPATSSGAPYSNNHFLQQIIDSVARAGGGTVRIGAGRYQLRDALRLANNVRIVGVPGKTVLVMCPGRKTLPTADLKQGATTLELADAAGFHVGDGIAIEDQKKRGFETTTATITRRLGPKKFRISVPLEDDYALERGASVRLAFPVVSGLHVKGASLEGITVEGNFNRPGAEYLNGCRGGGIYLYDCHDTTIRNCTVRYICGDAISFQRNCTNVTVENCLAELNSNAGLHPGSGSHHCVVRNNRVVNNGYVGLFVCVAVKHVLFEGNQIESNGGCGISIGQDDSDNLFRSNRVVDNAAAGVLFRKGPEEGAHRNVFEKNTFLDNLRPRAAKCNSNPASAGRASVLLEGDYDDIVFRDNVFGFSAPGKAEAAVLVESASKNLKLENNRLDNLGVEMLDEHAAK